MKLGLRKGDMVVVRHGASRGKVGKVLHVFRDRGCALVEGLRLVRKAVRKNPDMPKGGFVDKESPIALSQLMLYCPRCKKGVRIRRIRDGERRVRACRFCGQTFGP